MSWNSSVTSVSWIPSEAVTGMTKLPFEVGFTHYDKPPPDVIEKLIETYIERRDSDAERFVDTVHRIGIEPFKERVYGGHHQGPESRQRSLAAA